MRYELQKTFDINLRLSNWASKGKYFSGEYPTIKKTNAMSWENEKQ
jgi:hypothetical protein